jgi:hypothetical protein
MVSQVSIAETSFEQGLMLEQMRSFGLFSIITQAKSPLMNQHGQHTLKQTGCSQKPSLQTYKTTI